MTYRYSVHPGAREGECATLDELRQVFFRERHCTRFVAHDARGYVVLAFDPEPLAQKTSEPPIQAGQFAVPVVRANRGGK